MRSCPGAVRRGLCGIRPSGSGSGRCGAATCGSPPIIRGQPVTKTFNLAWLTSGVTAKRVDELAKSLDVGLHSPGVCPMCLLLVATELECEDGRPAAGPITMIARTLWVGRLARPVRDALDRHGHAGM